ncbi:MAG: DUF4625 domain-containing protein [Breznakibacter sp.]
MTKQLLFISLSLLAMGGCQSSDVDDVAPVIDMSFAGAFPQNCQQVNRGETFVFKARFTDNTELGSFNIDVHHNFDHHSHSTDAGECDFDEKKTAVTPFVFIQEYDIEPGQKEYAAEISIAIPENVDTGDYHLMISLTDHEGWNTVKGISIKIK